MKQINLVSDIAGVAERVDPDLVNPWGLSRFKGLWAMSDNGTGLATFYNDEGKKSSLVITIPTPSGTGTSAPTGNVVGKRGIYFSTEDGTVALWNGLVATIVIDNSASGAVYKGITIIDNLLYVANFNSGFVEVYNPLFQLVKTFTDSFVPLGFAPFNVKNINGSLFVTFALQNGAKHDDVAGPGNGFVDLFTPDGLFEKRLISNGVLNSPWGLTITPKSWHGLDRALLVGNFGDGRINAFCLKSGKFLKQLSNQINGLWSIEFRCDSLFLTAGIDDEAHGLFAKIK